MTPLSKLYSRFFHINRYAQRNTFKGILLISAAAFVATLLSCFLVVVPLQVTVSLAAKFAGLSEELSDALASLVMNIGQIPIMIFGLLSAVALAFASVKLLNNEDIPPKQLTLQSLQFATSKEGLILALIYAALNSIATFGYLFLIIPGLIFSNIVAITLFRLIDTQCQLGEAISFSWNGFKSSLVSNTFYFFSIGLLLILLMACTLLFATPILPALFTLATAVFYGSLTDKPIFQKDSNSNTLTQHT